MYPWKKYVILSFGMFFCQKVMNFKYMPLNFPPLNFSQLHWHFWNYFPIRRGTIGKLSLNGHVFKVHYFLTRKNTIWQNHILFSRVNFDKFSLLFWQKHILFLTKSHTLWQFFTTFLQFLIRQFHITSLQKDMKIFQKFQSFFYEIK